MANIKCVGNACVGCTACANVCPVGCISFSNTEKGFRYPEIDESKCIECGACVRVCEQIEGEADIRKEPQGLYAAISKNESLRKCSRSGGAFAEMAQAFASDGGFVWGAAFDGELGVVHKCVDTAESVGELSGSKYVQSELGNSFKGIYDQLKQGKKVLFSGTPCQVAGLKRFLNAKKADVSRLYTVDLICHGVGSPRLYRDYLKFSEKRLGEKINSFNFRDKSDGWYDFVESFETQSGVKHKSHCLATLFCNNYSLRPACFDCKYTSFLRVGDITLGDFHGIEKRTQDDRFLDNKGVSCVLVNTEKGQEWANVILDKMDVFVFDEQDIKKLGHPNLRHPSRKPSDYDVFWRKEGKKGFKYVAARYGYYGKRGKLFCRLDRIKGAVKRRIAIKK